MTVSQFNYVKTKSLQLPDGMAFSRAKARQLLGGISRSTCWRYLTCLLEEQPKGFDYLPGNRYLTAGTVEVMYQFKQLLEMFEYEGAKPRIKQHMEIYYVIRESSR